MNVDIWFCPECWYIVTDIEHEASRYDYDCPRCHKKKLSEFTFVPKRKAKRNHLKIVKKRR